jgi:pimeloyl-ACP methyl ester carboxylesterase
MRRRGRVAPRRFPGSARRRKFPPSRREVPVAIFIVAHGAWSAGWAWRKMRPLLGAAGHTLVTPTYTGLGERGHLASPTVDLNTHISDVVGVLSVEDLSGVILIGHSYGGMVATGVADRARDRISKLVYLDAFVPRDGESLYDLLSPEFRARSWQATAEHGDGWRVPPNPMPPDTSEADRAWAMPRRLPQPILTFQQRLKVTQPPPLRHYIYCKATCSGNSRSKRSARAGPITSSTRAITRTSPCRKRWPPCLVPLRARKPPDRAG